MRISFFPFIVHSVPFDILIQDRFKEKDKIRIHI